MLKSDSIVNNVINIQKTIFKDSTRYSEKFIKDIKEYNSEDLKFIDSLLIIGNDTAFIPVKLPLNKKISFTGCGEDNVCYTLVVQRINYSTIKYKIEKNIKRVKCYIENGNADLDHNFNYLDKDDEYDDEMKYSTITSDSCNLTIRMGTNYNNVLCAKLERSFCKSDAKDIYNCPVLKTLSDVRISEK
ncbi:MAG: hypothetical protein HY951_06170 [Bacteroidia bacterium]|nr:hypothetical protein [Bacteroidia bacterium]